MSTTRMSAEDALALFDAPEPQEPSMGIVADPVDEPIAGYVAYHPEKGVFIGIAPGEMFGAPGAKIALWSGMESGGQAVADLFESPDLGHPYFVNVGAARPEMLPEIEYFAAASGHWRDLQAIGLNVHDMPFNGHYHSNHRYAQ